MGMNIDCMLYLQRNGLLTAEKNRMLDIGPQNVYFASAPKISKLVEHQGLRSGLTGGDKLQKEIERVAYFSTPRPEERTTLFSEIAGLTNIEYNAFDVCPAPNTEILDLNFDVLPPHYVKHYDVVLNFGTTEHVFNQWNSFELMHDACAVGGVIYCVLPMSGYLDHGYYCYTPLFFQDMAKANGYEMIDLFIAQAGQNNVNMLSLDTRKEGQFDEARSARLSDHDAHVPNFNIHAVMRKTRDTPFSATLEVATAHSAVDEDIASRYGSGARNRTRAGSSDQVIFSDQALSSNEEISASTEGMSEVDARIAERDRARTERDEFRRQNQRLSAEVAARIIERDRFHTERDEYQSQLRALRASKSWRVTAPIRAAMHLLNGRR